MNANLFTKENEGFGAGVRRKGNAGTKRQRPSQKANDKREAIKEAGFRRSFGGTQGKKTAFSFLKGKENARRGGGGKERMPRRKGND